MAVNAYDRASYSQLKLPTFQEMMIAPQYLTEQHEMAQARADELLSEAQKVELAAMENPNGKAAQLYQGYTQRLNEAVNSLNERGINASNIKANLGKLKADYNVQIAPIAQAWEQQRKDKEAYNAMTAKDRSLITAYDPSQTSIDAYLGRNNASYIPQGISGDEIAQRVARAAKPYSDWISQRLPEIAKTGLPSKYFTMVQKGFSPDDVAAAMRDDGIDAQTASEGALMLKDLRDNVIASSGAYELFGNNPEAINRLIQYANTGLSQAIGTKQFGNISDDYTADINKIAYTQALKNQASELPGRRVGVFSRPVASSKNIQRGKEIDSALEELNKLDPGSKIDNSVTERYTPTIQSSITGYGMEGYTSQSSVAKALKALGVTDKEINQLTVQEAKDKLLKERDDLVTIQNGYYPNIPNSSNINSKIRNYLLTSSDEGGFLEYDFNEGAPKKDKKGNRLHGKDAADFLKNDDIVYVYSPQSGMVASDGEKAYQVPAEALEPLYGGTYRKYDGIIKDLISNKPEGPITSNGEVIYNDWREAAADLSEAIVNILSKEQADFVPVRSTSSSKTY